MNDLIHILPVLTVLVAAVALMFMSMYEEKFSTKTFIITSSVVLVIALIFSFIPFGGELYSVRPYDSIFNDVLIFDTFSNFFLMFY